MVAALAGVPCKRGFRRREPERNRRDAAGGDADELERAVRHHGAGADFDQRPFRMAAADGALVERALAWQRRRQLDTPDHFAWRSALSAAPLEPSPSKFADRKRRCAGRWRRLHHRRAAPPPWSRDAAQRRGRDRRRRCRDDCPIAPDNRVPPFLRQAICGLRKYQQRERCARLPPSVARWRTCGVARPSAAAAMPG